MPTYSILLFLLICHDKPLQRSVLAEVKKDQLTEEKKQNETEDGIKMEMEKLVKKVNGFETKEGMNNSRSRKLLPRETYLVKAEADGAATLPCKFTMKSDIHWKFQKMVIIEYINGNVNHFHKRVEFIGNLKKGNASISIKDLHFNDSGEYMCEETYISGGGYVEEHVLVNLTVTETTVPPPETTVPPPETTVPPPETTVPPTKECSSHIVAIAVLAILLVVGVAFAVFLNLFKRCGRFCWRENIENIPAEEKIPMNARSSSNGHNDGEKDGDDGGVQTSLASDLEHNNVDVT